jgi:hypothetical protein
MRGGIDWRDLAGELAIAVAAACNSCRRRDEQRAVDPSLQIHAQAFGRQIETGDPAIELIGLYAEAAREPVRPAERLRRLERRRDEIRHADM